MIGGNEKRLRLIMPSKAQRIAAVIINAGPTFKNFLKYFSIFCNKNPSTSGLNFAHKMQTLLSFRLYCRFQKLAGSWSSLTSWTVPPIGNYPPSLKFRKDDAPNPEGYGYIKSKRSVKSRANRCKMLK